MIVEERGGAGGGTGLSVADKRNLLNASQAKTLNKFFEDLYVSQSHEPRRTFPSEALARSAFSKTVPESKNGGGGVEGAYGC